MPNVRPYQESDYEDVITLYKRGELFGGQFDLARDSKEKLREVTTRDPESILVCEVGGNITGSISLIEDGRVAWLFRFTVTESEQMDDVAQALYTEACRILKSRGHEQVLVYSDPNNDNLNQRYAKLGMTEGSVFRCFWEEM